MVKKSHILYCFLVVSGADEFLAIVGLFLYVIVDIQIMVAGMVPGVIISHSIYHEFP